MTGVNSGETMTVNVSVTRPPLTIGSTVNYSTSLNGVTLDDWKVFYTEGDYTYLIYGDYMPNAALPSSTGLNKAGDYGIVSYNSREALVNGMTSKSNWDNLLSGTINGHPVNEARTDKVWAIGSPTIELWVDSWNAYSPDDPVTIKYVTQAEADLDENDYLYTEGYAVSDGINWVDSSVFGLTNNNPLYLPDKEGREIYGYWLASPDATDDRKVYMFDSNADMLNGFDHGYYCDEPSFRPVVCLPTSVVNQ